MVTPNNPQPVDQIVRAGHHVGKALGIVGPLRHGDRDGLHLSFAQHADVDLLPHLVGVEIERELAQVIDLLAADAGNDLADLQACLVGAGTRRNVFQHHALSRPAGADPRPAQA